ncbi:response regulator [Cohnella fermenti]|uniref:Response regulator n=1 Tax=Cohnella fermenti TaxID=2565925 RepID=A0A4S4BL37_9BACL|nr:response regulator [Cohnella fermenti]THF72956.1 response regulator [Cohnella fermenti]
MRIVVVEDEHNAREGLVRIIGKLGSRYEVVGEADNGLDGIDVIDRTKPDLVITDIKMPGMSGLEMLGTLKNKGLRHKMIILTGYSEFEYAHKALKMSVSDYLEKPITVPDLQEALDKVEQELRQLPLVPEGSDEPGSLDSLFLRLMDCSREEAERQEALIRAKFGFRDEIPFCIAICCYDGSNDKQPSILRELLKSSWRSVGIGLVYDMASRSIVVSIVQAADADFDPAKFADERLLPEIAKAGFVVECCLGDVSRLSELKKAIEELLELAKWSMILGNRRAIRREDPERLTKRELPYPALLESNCLRAIVNANKQEIERQFQNWVHAFKDMKYGPVLTIEYSIRFVSYMLRLAGDIHGYMLPEPLQSEWQRSLREIRTIRQFGRAMDEIASALASMNSPEGQPVYSLLIQKAVRMIQERYAEGITLDEIADHLRVTTAYLSGQFTRDVGRRFSEYIRDIRLRKAKELLLGSELRTFEIAQKAGYPDPKYFSRVFKEATGMTPGEFQKLNDR